MKWQQSWWWLSLGGAHIVDFTWITLNFAEQLDNNWSQVYMLSQVTRLSSNQDNLVTKYRNDENILGIARRSWRAGQCGETTSKGCPTYQAMASSSQTLAGKDMYPWNYPKLVPQTPSRQPPDTIGFYNIQTFSGLGGTWGEGGSGEYPGDA